VIIPARDAAATLGTQLEALATQDVPVAWEVIVVDNGSTDGTGEVCARFQDRLALSVLPCPTPGTSAARNAGARAARGEHLLFCDADDEVAPGWVAAMSRGLGTHDAVGGRIDDEALNGHLRYVPRHPDGLPVVAGFLPRTISANLGVRADVFAAVGGFREVYTYGSDDTELSWRLQLAGHTLGYVPDAVVRYRHRSRTRDVAVKAFRTGRSRGRLFREYRGAGMPQPRLAGAVLRWARLLALVPVAPWRPAARWRLADQAGAALGRVVGSLEQRVLYL
jgi:glycosyltransferase involved in cell wall biosynthesis